MLNDSGYEAMLRQGGEEERLDNIAELKQSVFEFEKSAGEETFLEEYLQNVSLYTNVDQETRKNSLKLMTIHTAKGLEFPYVFVCGLNEGIFPSKHVDTLDRLEEERRLAYVAYTRAEQALFLSDSEGKNFDGSFRYPSRFIFNTDKNYLDYTAELEDRLFDSAKEYISISETKIWIKEGISNPSRSIVANDSINNDEAKQENDDMIKIGDNVLHKVFGAGVVENINMDTSSYVIKFEKLGTSRNISFSAPLQLV